MPQKKIIVYAISDDYEKIRDIEKSLWKNKQSIPFGETSVEIVNQGTEDYGFLA